MSAAMEFITLTTGATYMSGRDEVTDGVIEQIGHALAADGTLWAGWSVKCEQAPGGAAFIMLMHDVAVAQCMLCWDQTVSDETWEVVQNHVPDRVVAHRPRGVPWLAVSILPAAVLQYPDKLMELADAERCVAWTLLDAMGKSA
jgi:hypothetical protein